MVELAIDRIEVDHLVDAQEEGRSLGGARIVVAVREVFADETRSLIRCKERTSQAEDQ